ncbi:MAG: glycoside hydrolase family 75 protein [Candidatus Krumholzibacteriia bacterium]
MAGVARNLRSAAGRGSRRGGLALALAAGLLVPGCAPQRVTRPVDTGPARPADLFATLDRDGARAIPHHGYLGAEALLLLADGTLLIRAGLEIDADGSPNARALDPRHGQLTTSLQYPGQVGQDRYVDAERVPYIVLPRGLPERFGIALGDLAAVRYRGRTVFAVFADVGPADRLGEGSIRLAELLGHRPWERWDQGESFSTHGGISSREVEFLVLPGVRVPLTSNATAEADIAAAGARVGAAR